MQLVFLALDHGIDSVRASGGPLIPFLMTQAGTGVSLMRFAADTLEAGLANAEQAADSAGPKIIAYAIARDGFLTVGGERLDAILVEAGERGDQTGFVFAQRYRPKKGLFGRFEVVGNAALAGEGPQRLRAG